ncbi:MAG TPA: hypothetical protein PLK99_04320, partial [Burkholderiales bacterium]|nr:hypothetical protein [Burkholderiales bacterium]
TVTEVGIREPLRNTCQNAEASDTGVNNGYAGARKSHQELGRILGSGFTIQHFCKCEGHNRQFYLLRDNPASLATQFQLSDLTGFPSVMSGRISAF